MSTISGTVRTIILLAALLLTGCATLPPPPVARAVYPADAESTDKVVLADPAALLNVEWQLVEIRPSGDSPLVVENPGKYTLQFADNGTLGGQLDCNFLSGTFTLDGDKLVFGPIASTMAFCPEDGILSTYSAALNSANSYAVADDRLRISYGAAAGVLIYAPALNAQLPVGVVWHLQAIQMMNDEVFTPGQPDAYTLELSADGTAGGQVDCNQFSGSYSLDGSALTFGPLSSTRAMCPEDSLYDRYMQGLGDTNSFVLQDGHLFVAFGPDAGILEFAPATDSASAAGVTEADLTNGTYPGIYDEQVQLTDGAFAGEPFVAGGASRPTVTLVPDTTALGDLNGDGLADGVAVLVDDSGGSGTFVYLAARLAEKNASAMGVTLLLGDRVRVESMAIVNGQIEVVAATFTDSDPMCCPSLRTRFLFALEQGALVELSAEKL
ncbi:MAG: META domain-containing protein [Caldilineaceae bacterium]|nr:META domain-containing protein [Caldilineaceae bacterium]